MSEVFAWHEAPKADFAVIGDPVDHSLSPAMHMAAYAALGLPYRYVAVQAPSGEVAEALDHLRGIGYRGVNVTVPHKEDAFRWAVEADAFTSRIAAANTLDLQAKRATNTDGPGLIDTLAAAGIRPGSSVLLLGGGGAGRAAALALAETGYGLALYNRTRARADRLVAELQIDAAVLNHPQGQFDVVINATSAGLEGHSPEFVWESARPGVAYDMLYCDKPTPFLEEALRHEWIAIDGRPLLVAQGARAFQWWLDIPAPLAAMAGAVE